MNTSLTREEFNLYLEEYLNELEAKYKIIPINKRPKNYGIEEYKDAIRDIININNKDDFIKIKIN